MTIKMDFAISAKLNADTVKEIIKNYVEKETSRTVSSITLDTKTEWHGYGPNEYQTTVFNGATVHFKS